MKARSFARWLDNYELPEATVLDDAGLSSAEKQEKRALQVELIETLSVALYPKAKGRRRKEVSTYYLNRDAISLLETGHAALSMPRKLIPIARRMISATKRRRGPKMTFAEKQRNLRNGYYSPETVRRIKWEERKRSEARALRERTAKLGLFEGPLAKPFEANFPIFATIAARRFLV